MKKIILAVAFSMAALVGCSSEAPVDSASLDQRTQGEAMEAKAKDLASTMPLDRDGKPIAPAGWSSFNSTQPMHDVAVDAASERAQQKVDIADDDWKLPGDGKSHDMRSTCYDAVSFESCCYWGSYPTFCCIRTAGGYGHCSTATDL